MKNLDIVRMNKIDELRHKYIPKRKWSAGIEREIQDKKVMLLLACFEELRKQTAAIERIEKLLTGD